MSSALREESLPQGSAASLKDELASLRIERKRTAASPRASMAPQRAVRRRDAGTAGLRLLSLGLWIIPITLIGGSGYFAYLQYQKTQPKASVTTARVEALSPGEAHAVLSAKGYLKSRYQAAIGAKVPGRIKEVLVEEGVRVKKGDVLAVLEHDDLKAQVDSRKAMLARSRFELEEAQSDLDNKRDRAQRYRRLRSLGQTSDDEADQVISAWRMSDSRVRSLEASIVLQESMIHETEVSIEDMIIRSPFDGTVVEKGAEVGETILIGGMGAASGRGSVARVANLEKMEVETDVSEAELSLLDEGHPAEVTVSAVPDHRYRARLRSVVPLGDRGKGTVKVYVEIIEPDGRLFPELAASVRFLPGGSQGTQLAQRSKERALYIPGGAVIEKNGQTFAWVVDRSGFVRQTVVKVEPQGERRRVLEGLQEGQTVVVDPPHLEEGQKVEVKD